MECVLFFKWIQNGYNGQCPLILALTAPSELKNSGPATLYWHFLLPGLCCKQTSLLCYTGLARNQPAHKHAVLSSSAGYSGPHPLIAPSCSCQPPFVLWWTAAEEFSFLLCGARSKWPVCLAALTVRGFWSWGTRTSSCVRVRRTSAGRTPASGLSSACTSLSPAAVSSLCRQHQTPSSAVSTLRSAGKQQACAAGVVFASCCLCRSGL